MSGVSVFHLSVSLQIPLTWIVHCWTRASDLIDPSVNPCDKEQQIWFSPSKKRKKKKGCLAAQTITVYNSTKLLCTTLRPISDYCRTLLLINSTLLEPIIHLLYQALTSLNDCECTHGSQHSCACPRLLAGIKQTNTKTQLFKRQERARKSQHASWNEVAL